MTKKINSFVIVYYQVSKILVLSEIEIQSMTYLSEKSKYYSL